MARVLGTTIAVMLLAMTVTSMPQIDNIADDATVNPVDELLRQPPTNIAEQFAKDLMKSMKGIRHHCEEMEADVERNAESSIASLSQYQEHINDIMNAHHQNMTEEEKLAIQNNFRKAFQEIFVEEQAKENKIAMNCTKEFEEIMMKKMTLAVNYCKTLFQQSTSDFTSLIQNILDYSTRLQNSLDACLKQYPPTDFNNPLKIGSPSYQCKQIEIQILSQFVNELVIRSTTGLLTGNTSNSNNAMDHGHVMISSLVDQIPEIFPRPPTPSAKPSTDDDIELISTTTQDIDTTTSDNEDNENDQDQDNADHTHYNHHHGNHGGHHHGNHGGNHHGNHGGHHHGNHGGHHHGNHGGHHHGSHNGNHHGNHSGHHGNHHGNHHGGHHHGNHGNNHHGGHHNGETDPEEQPSRPTSTQSHGLHPSTTVYPTENRIDDPTDIDPPVYDAMTNFDYIIYKPTNTANTPSASEATEDHELSFLLVVCGGVCGVLLILILMTSTVVLYLKYRRYSNRKWSQLTEDEKVVVMKKSGYINPTYEFFDKVTATN